MALGLMNANTRVRAACELCKVARKQVCRVVYYLLVGLLESAP
jgi:hypothetical protein